MRLFATAILLILMGTPARAHIVGYSCAATEKVGSGEVRADQSFNIKGQPGRPELAWTIVLREAEGSGPTLLNIRYQAPSTLSPDPRPFEAFIQYHTAGVLTPPVWIAARMGSSIQMISPDLDHAFNPPGPVPGSLNLVRLGGAGFAAAFERGAPLELYLLDRHGTPVATRLYEFAAREEAKAALKRLWATVESKATQPKRLCSPQYVEE